MKNEQFKPAIYIWQNGEKLDLSGYYQISADGIVKSVSRKYNPNEHTMAKIIDQYGYERVSITVNKKRYFLCVHRLLLSTFKPEADTYESINHKDCNKLNNTLENLEWCDTAFNNSYNGHNDTNNKPVAQYDLEGNFVAWYKSASAAARAIGGCAQSINGVCNNKPYRKTAHGYVWKYA